MSRIAYLGEIKHIHHSNEYLPADCELWKWKKEVKAIRFIFVFFCLGVQLLSYKEFMFPIQQMLIGHLIDIAKVLQKKKKMTFRNNKLNSY